MSAATFTSNGPYLPTPAFLPLSETLQCLAGATRETVHHRPSYSDATEFASVCTTNVALASGFEVGSSILTGPGCHGLTEIAATTPDCGSAGICIGRKTDDIARSSKATLARVSFIRQSTDGYLHDQRQKNQTAKGRTGETARSTISSPINPFRLADSWNQGLGWGVGRGRGVGVTLIGVAVGVTVGVGDGGIDGVGVGVGLPPPP